MVEYFKEMNKQPVEPKNACFLCLKSLATEFMYKKKHIPQFSPPPVRCKYIKYFQ